MPTCCGVSPSIPYNVNGKGDMIGIVRALRTLSSPRVYAVPARHERSMIVYFLVVVSGHY